MITESVIKEIYKNYNKPPKHREELNLQYFIDLLKPHHNLVADDMEIVVEDLDDCNPFKRFLIRGLTAILEFDRNVAFVFHDHILLFSKHDSNLNVNFKPDSQGFLAKLFRSDK